MSDVPGVSVEISGGVATITFNRPKSLNAMTREDYNNFGEALRVIDQRDDVLVTLWQAHGRYFCAGTDVTATNNTARTQREFFLTSMGPSNTDVPYALHKHTKLLVAALHGPVIGLAAAFLGHFDFIYALPGAWFAMPFTNLGLVAEGGVTVTFPAKIGAARSRELLIFGKKKEAQELLEWGLYNKIFPQQSVPEFHAAVRKHILSELDGLDTDSVLGMKKILKVASEEQNSSEGAVLREGYAQASRFATGVPGERFRKIANKEIKHKL